MDILNFKRKSRTGEDRLCKFFQPSKLLPQTRRDPFEKSGTNSQPKTVYCCCCKVCFLLPQPPTSALSMPKSGKKRKAPGAWKKVDVGLPEGAGEEDDNHYDSHGLQKQAAKDLEAQPGEEMGFFLGLEVIGGDDYRMEKRNGSQIFILKDTQDVDSSKKNKAAEVGPESKVKKDDKDGATPEKETKRPKKKRKKKVKDSKAVKGDAVGETSHVQEGADHNVRDSVDDMAEADQPVETKKPKKKKKKKSKNRDGESDITFEQKKGGIDEAEIARMQTAWMSQTGGVTLHQEICKSLFLQDFWTPTPIQAGCLPAAILGRRNIVGAAPTGSGKVSFDYWVATTNMSPKISNSTFFVLLSQTLAFLLPIFQTLLDEEDSREEDGDESDQPLKALILTPTRELANQIFAECEKLASRRVALVVGGLAHVKQRRLLSRRPSIVVGTPGRLWEMVCTNDACFYFSMMRHNIPTNPSVSRDEEILLFARQSENTVWNHYCLPSCQ